MFNQVYILLIRLYYFCNSLFHKVTNLAHLGQVQGRPPALHADARLRATAGEAHAAAALQFRRGVRGAGRRGSAGLGEADRFVREVGGQRRGLRGRSRGGGRRQASEGRGAGESAGGVGAGRQAEAGAALHGREGRLRVGRAAPAALDAAAAVAPPLHYRRPHAGALRAPGRAAAGELLRARQGAALPLAGGRGGVRGPGLGQAEVAQQAGDGGRSGADVPVPVGGALVHLGQDVPQALQAGADRPRLYSAAVTQLAPPACLCIERTDSFLFK